MDSHGERLLNSESDYPWYCGLPDDDFPGTGSGSRRPTEANRCTTPASSCRSRRTHWPWFVWFLLKLLGLYNRRPAVTGRRLCLECRLVASEKRAVIRGNGVAEYLYLGSEEEEDDYKADSWQAGDARSHPNGEVELGQGFVSSEPCVVCQSQWWDGQGKHRPYTEEEIGIKRWNHYGSSALSVVWHTLIIGLNIVHFAPYLDKYWGKVDQTVDLVIYGGFVLFLISVPLLCLTANILNMLKSCRARRWCYSWSNALGVRYIVKRLQHLGLRERGLPLKAFLMACIVWPVLNSGWRFALYYFVFHKGKSVQVNISLFACSAGMLVWAAFCYLVAMMRLSFQRQLEMELAFLRKHVGRLDRCRQRLATCMEDLGSLGSLVSMWIMFTIAVSTWGIATQVYLDYKFQDQMNNKTFHTGQNLDQLIWSENAMFLLLPLFAAGGLDLNRLWIQFRRRIVELQAGGKGKRLDTFCEKILAYCSEDPPVRNTETMTLLVSALGLCLAVEFREIDAFDIDKYT